MQVVQLVASSNWRLWRSDHALAEASGWLAANILVGSIPGVLIGSQLAVKVPTVFLRNALGLVLIASSIALITKEHVPQSILIPSMSVAALVIAGLFAFQIGLHRQRQRRAGAQAPAAAS